MCERYKAGDITKVEHQGGITDVRIIEIASMSHGSSWNSGSMCAVQLAAETTGEKFLKMRLRGNTIKMGRAPANGLPKGCGEQTLRCECGVCGQHIKIVTQVMSGCR